jgi:hypothetical protein
MGGLRAAGILAALAALFFGGLWIVHVTVPIFYPEALRGPFVIENIEEAERYSGYSPLAPFYRPEKLGQRPISITVTRRPHGKVVVFWQGEKFLYLSQELDSQKQVHRSDRRSFPDHGDTTWWQEGSTHYLQFRKDDLWLEMRTDLSEQEIGRILDTLRPVKEQI